MKVFLDDTGHLPNIGQTRTVVNELQAELTRSESHLAMGNQYGTLCLQLNR